MIYGFESEQKSGDAARFCLTGRFQGRRMVEVTARKRVLSKRLGRACALEEQVELNRFAVVVFLRSTLRVVTPLFRW